eukprot:gene4375-biopygen3558
MRQRLLHRLMDCTWLGIGEPNQQPTEPGDFLRDYNLKDVRPFLRSVENYALQLREKGVDQFRDGISLPGLAKAILSHTIPPNTFHYIDNAELYMRIYKSEVGGQSIIMKRINELPYVKGYDANALYLHSMCKPQFVGRPRVYRQVAGSVMVRTEIPPSSMRLTEKRRLRDVALGVGTEGSPIRIGERRDSREARLFLDYLDRCVLTPRRVVLQRQKYLRLCRSEIDVLQGKYAELFGNGDGLQRAPRFFVVDGMFVDYEHDQTDDDDEQRGRRREQRYVIEFEGCYWHACTREESKCRERFADKVYTRNGRRMTAAQVRTVDEARRTVLRQRGYRVITMKECIWRERCRLHDDPVRAFVEERRREREDDPLERCADWVGYTTQETLIDALLQRKVFGLITCDVHVPEEHREYFREFALIIKHAHVNYADVGEFTQTVADENGITIKNRKCVIDSYIGQHITITDEYFVWLLEHYVECTRVYDFIRYDKQPIFAEFGRDITRLRVQGDRDKSSEMKANTAKLVGNSAFGSCITNKDKHQDVRLVSLLEQQDGRIAKTRMLTRDQLLANRQTRREIASMNTFVRYEQVCAQVLEVESKKRRILYDQPRYIGKTIFDRAKLSVLTFVYDFLKRVLKPDHFELLETDTDSIYLGMKEDRFEDNVAEDKREEYKRLKHDYFVTEKCEFGKREPNRYKLEFSGHRMVSLCSKSYCGFNETTHDVKISSKGVQKRNFVQQSIERRQQQQKKTDGQDISDIIYDIYREGLKTDPHDDCKMHTSTNRGIKRKNNLMQTYVQEKNTLNSLYCKRRVLEDGIILTTTTAMPPVLRTIEKHESIATAQLILSECTMDLTTIVLENDDDSIDGDDALTAMMLSPTTAPKKKKPKLSATAATDARTSAAPPPPPTPAATSDITPPQPQLSPGSSLGRANTVKRQ